MLLTPLGLGAATVTLMRLSLVQLLERKTAIRRLPDPEVRRLLRIRAGITQAELAAALDVSRPAVCRWERGQRSPTGERLEAYLEALERLARVES